MMMMMMMVEVEVVGLWKVVLIVLWVQRWRETTGALRREETKLMIARRRFWGEKKMK